MNYKFIDLIEAQDLLSHGTPVIVLKEDYSNITFYVRIDNNDVKLLIINKNNDGLSPIITLYNNKLCVGYGYSFCVIEWNTFSVDRQYTLNSLIYDIFVECNTLIIISELDVTCLNNLFNIVLNKFFNNIIIGYEVLENKLIVSLDNGENAYVFL